MIKAIVNGKIITKDEILLGKAIVLSEGKIIDITDTVPEVAQLIDAKGMYVAPGFIDVHIHGSVGADVMDGSVQAIQKIATEVVKYGTTSFLPTTLTMKKEAIYQSLKMIRKLQTEGTSGAQVLGAHLEGPFINEKYKGAQNACFIETPNYDWIADFSDVIKLITYAPEVDLDFAFAKKIKEETDINLAIGHSAATYEQACKAIEVGCSHVTHLFNGMSGLHHRDPGVVGAALTTDVFTELIADKVHVNEKIFQFVLHNKGSKRIILITDSMRAAGLEDGIYHIGEQDAFIKDGVASLSDGTLAGSLLTLNKAVKNFYEATEATLPQVIGMASLNPAISIKADKDKGSLEITKDADIIFLDEGFNCHLTMVRGEIMWRLI